MKARATAIAAILVAAFALRAQDATPPLAVRKDGLRPGWFFVGVVPGVGTDTPILIELRAGSESAPVRRFRSPHPRSFDLCALLRTAGFASQAGPLYLLVSRGPASFRFSIPYNGKLCAAQAAPSPGEAAPPASASSGLAPLVLTLPPAPAAEPEPAAPAIAQATPVPASPTVAAAPATPAVQEAPAPSSPPVAAVPAPAAASQASPPRPSSPSPSSTPAAAVAAVAAPTAPTTPPPAAAPPASRSQEEAAAASGLSAADRGLTTENFDGLSAFLLKDEKLGTNDIRFVLRFKRPVNIEGVESVVFLRARLAKGRTYEFLDRGQENFLDPADDPANTLSLSTTVPMGLALETAGVNHVLTVEIQVGADPALAVFGGRVGIKRGLER